LSDLALGALVAALVAVPASLLALAFFDVIRLPDEERRHRWINRCLVALSVPAALLLGLLFWGWAGAAHLGPLCAAYARPEFRNEAPLVLRSLAIDSDQGAMPDWAPALLKTAGGPLDFLEQEPAAAGGSIQSAFTLEARRRTHHQNRWFKVEMDRFRLLDRNAGRVLAEGDEMWIQAGRARYHCGIGSGRRPTAQTPWPGGAGVARFVAAAMAGQGLARTAP
jgi:hypothetical protein